MYRNYSSVVENVTVPAGHTQIIVNGKVTYSGPNKDVNKKRISEQTEISPKKVRTGEKFGEKAEYEFVGWKIKFLKGNKAYTIIPRGSEEVEYVVTRDSSEKFDNNKFSFKKVKIGGVLFVKNGIVFEIPLPAIETKVKTANPIIATSPKSFGTPVPSKNFCTPAPSKKFGAQSEYNFGGWKIKFLDNKRYTIDSPPGSNINMRGNICSLDSSQTCNDVIFSPEKVSIHETVYVRNGIVLDTPEHEEFDIRSITMNFFK